MARNPDKTPKQNSTLLAMKKKVAVQAIIAVQTIIITIALIFGMSAAWYTNVLQTSGLQFEAESWGFTGEVLVSQEAVKAGPGESGIIGLTVTNMSDDMVNVAVHVSKAQMAVQMQQRMFFYVDAMSTRNGETMDRAYINTQDSYTYSVLSRGEMVANKERSNDAVLKWQWVYDMLGYYFVGTVSETTDAINNASTVIASVEDYLRPVEYNLDTATFTDGVLTTANGMSVADFLTALSATDGYAGEIMASDYDGYYKVNVDGNGHGIWIYLCNWAEIQQATIYDSQLGKAAADALIDGTQVDSFVARLTVIGQTTQVEYTEVSTVEQLVAAMNAGETVQLHQNITLTEPIVLNGGNKMLLDLNGLTITAPENAPMMQVGAGANLIMVNGDIQVPEDNRQDVICVNNGSLTLSNVNISGGGDDVIDIADQAGNADSCVRLFGSKIDAKGCAVYLRGNGSIGNGNTRVIIEDCVLNSEYITIMGNGTNSYWGTDVQIYNSALSGQYAAIYQPQDDSVTKVIASELSGITGIAVKGGNLVIVDSTIMGTGNAAQISAPEYAVSGFADTGDGIFIECGYENKINVTISGDNTMISSAEAKAIRVFEEGSHFASVIINGGTYSSDVSAFVPDGHAYDPATGKVSAVEGADDDA